MGLGPFIGAGANGTLTDTPAPLYRHIPSYQKELSEIVGAIFKSEMFVRNNQH